MDEIKNDEYKKNQPPKSLSVLYIVVCLLAGIAIGMLGTKILTKDNNKNDDSINMREITSKSTINRLERFIEVSYFSGTADLFSKGISSLSKEQKLKIAYDAIVKVDNKIKEVNDLPLKYKDDESLSLDNKTIYEISKRDFDKEYEKLFNEEAKYKEEDLLTIGCPSMVKVDNELDKIYLSSECSDSEDPKYFGKIVSYNEDRNYYYVTQYVGYQNMDGDFYKEVIYEKIDVDKFDGNEEKFEKLIWKFDKEFNFISTEPSV